MANLGNTIINGILRVNGSLNVGGSITASSFTGDLTGNATSATKLETARTINGVAFNGTKNITVADSTKLPLAGGTMTGTIKSSVTTTYLNGNNGSAVVNSTAAGSAYVTLLRKKSTNGVFTVNGYQGNFILGYTSDTTIEADNNTLDKALYFGESGTLYPSINNSQNLGDSSHKWKNVYATTFTGALSGNASTATKLATARTINGVSFDGTKNITITDSTKLPLAGGTVTGRTYFNQGTSVKTINSGSGKTGYFKVCTFKITGNYQNQCIKLHTTQRNRFGNLYIIFSSVNSTNPSISAFYKDGSGIVARLVKTSNGVFDLYIQKQEAYDDLEVTLLEKGSYMSGTTITWVNATVSTLPNTTDFPTYKDATWLPVSGNAATATKLATARTISLSGDVAGSASFDGSQNITITTTAAQKRETALIGSDDSGAVGWYKVMEQTMSGYANSVFTFAVSGSGSSYFGILTLNMRSDRTVVTCKRFQWLSRIGFDPNHFIIVIDGMKWTLYHYYTINQYYRTLFEIIAKQKTNGIEPATYTFQDNTTKETTTPTATVTSTDGGTVLSATKLATARTIGVSGVTGTAQSFNGTKNIVIPITAVPASLLTGKSSIKGSEITNDKHWVPSSDNSVKNFMAMSATNFASNAGSLSTGTIVAITDGVEGYVTTQSTGLTCDLPLDL